MARTSARAKPVDLKKAKFNMKGFFNEAPTVREEAAAVRAEMAYDRNRKTKEITYDWEIIEKLWEKGVDNSLEPAII